MAATAATKHTIFIYSPPTHTHSVTVVAIPSTNQTPPPPARSTTLRYCRVAVSVTHSLPRFLRGGVRCGDATDRVDIRQTRTTDDPIQYTVYIYRLPNTTHNNKTMRFWPAFVGSPIQNKTAQFSATFPQSPFTTNTKAGVLHRQNRTTNTTAKNIKRIVSRRSGSVLVLF